MTIVLITYKITNNTALDKKKITTVLLKQLVKYFVYSYKILSKDIFMDENGFVTVAEGAKLVGVSTSALYQRIKKGDLETVSEDGFTKLRREDLFKVFQISNEEEKDDSPETFNVLSKQLEVLQKECQVKNQQIEELHQQLEHLTQVLAMKEKNTQTQLMLMSAEKQRPSWWRRWFYKEKSDDDVVYHGNAD